MARRPRCDVRSTTENALAAICHCRCDSHHKNCAFYCATGEINAAPRRATSDPAQSPLSPQAGKTQFLRRASRRSLDPHHIAPTTGPLDLQHRWHRPSAANSIGATMKTTAKQYNGIGVIGVLAAVATLVTAEPADAGQRHQSCQTAYNSQA